jgi:16S rRNA U516 pseudouridylate synthase RsuA-like enzyme
MANRFELDGDNTLAVHKTPGVLSPVATQRSPASDRFNPIGPRLYNVVRLENRGRPDIVTNDGDLAQRLTIPSVESKKYLVLVVGGPIATKWIIGTRRPI